MVVPKNNCMITKCENVNLDKIYPLKISISLPADAEKMASDAVHGNSNLGLYQYTIIYLGNFTNIIHVCALYIYTQYS